MTLKERIEQDYKTAFKAGHHDVVGTLRFLKSQIKNAEIARRKDFDDNEALEVIIKDAKRHTDAIEQFQKGGRADLASREQAQLAVLEAYLPARLTDAELKDIVLELVRSAGAKGPGDLGKVMGLVMAKVRGQADGTKVKQFVSEALKTPTT